MAERTDTSVDAFARDVERIMGEPSDRARAGWMRPPPGRTVVAERDGVIVGSAFTQPNHRGPGCGACPC